MALWVPSHPDNHFPFSHSGEIKSGKFLLDWLSDDENRELVDEIEHVNPAMLDQLVAQSTYLAALFCEYFLKMNMTFK